MGLLAKGGVAIATLEGKTSGGDGYQPGNHPQQRRFAGAIPPGHHQGLACWEAEIQA